MAAQGKERCLLIVGQASAVARIQGRKGQGGVERAGRALGQKPPARFAPLGAQGGPFFRDIKPQCGAGPNRPGEGVGCIEFLAPQPGRSTLRRKSRLTIRGRERQQRLSGHHGLGGPRTLRARHHIRCGQPAAGVALEPLNAGGPAVVRRCAGRRVGAQVEEREHQGGARHALGLSTGAAVTLSAPSQPIEGHQQQDPAHPEPCGPRLGGGNHCA